MTRRVHDHGPTEGRGLDCPERRLPPDGRLRGACLPDDEAPCDHRVAIDIEDFSMDPPALAPVITVTGRLCVHCHTRLPLPTEETPE